MTPPYPFFTIGHSTRTLDALAALLEESGVRLLADVRTVPRSRTNPQFNRETLAGSLAPFAIGYEHIPELGGLRGKSQAGAPSPNLFWENQSFRNYADYALTPAFRKGLAHLTALGRGRPAAVMCSEALWWRCHRRIIADYLIAQGEKVFHILGPQKVEEATLTPAAKVMAGGIVYPPTS